MTYTQMLSQLLLFCVNVPHHRSRSAPHSGSSYTPDCDDTLKPTIGLTSTDVESAKEFYKRYAHHVGFSVRVGQHKVVDGVVLYRRFFCAKEGFRDDKNMQSSGKRKKLQIRRGRASQRRKHP